VVPGKLVPDKKSDAPLLRVGLNPGEYTLEAQNARLAVCQKFKVFKGKAAKISMVRPEVSSHTR